MQELTTLLTHYGLALVFANVLLTQLGVPLPALPVLIVAGALAQQGAWSPAALIGIAVAASLLGDLPWYIAGRLAGYRVLKTLCRVAIEPDSCVKQSESIFERWGAPSLLVAKFVPGFSIVAPPIAGALRLGIARFLIYSAVGAAVWAGAAIVVGMAFNHQIDRLLDWLAETGERTALVIGAAIGFYVALKWFERRMFIRTMRMARITIDELHELMQRQPSPIILDARSQTARRIDPRRIPGAIVVDIARPEIGLADVPTDRELIVYCT